MPDDDEDLEFEDPFGDAIDEDDQAILAGHHDMERDEINDIIEKVDDLEEKIEILLSLVITVAFAKPDASELRTDQGGHWIVVGAENRGEQARDLGRLLKIPHLRAELGIGARKRNFGHCISFQGLG